MSVHQGMRAYIEVRMEHTLQPVPGYITKERLAAGQGVGCVIWGDSLGGAGYWITD